MFEEWMLDIGRQVPALVVLSLLVWYVVKYFSEAQRQSHEAIRGIVADSNETSRAAATVIKENSEMYGRVAQVLDRVERRLEHLEQKVSHDA